MLNLVMVLYNSDAYLFFEKVLEKPKLICYFLGVEAKTY